jgi:hypothetical protein
MCEEMPVIPVDRVVDEKKNNLKNMEGRGGGEAQGFVDTPTPPTESSCFTTSSALYHFNNWPPIFSAYVCHGDFHECNWFRLSLRYKTQLKPF